METAGVKRGLSILILGVSMIARCQQTAPPPAPQAPQKSVIDSLFGATADFEAGVHTEGSELGVAKDDSSKTSRKGEFAFAPVPLFNPSIGDGLGVALLYTKGLDSESPPSTFAVAGFGTNNSSWGLGVGARMYLKNDTYRITAAYGLGTFNYNFFGIGSSAGSEGLAIPLSQRSKAYVFQPTRRVFRRWYVGPRYHHIGNRVSLNTSKVKDEYKGLLPPDGNLPVALPDHLNLTTAALGLSVKRDTSDSPFYPRSGSIFSVTADFFDSAFGAQLSYQTFNIEYNKYISLGAKNVLAAHGTICAATNGAPFFDVCLLGLSKDLRGYQIGQYRDNRMLVGQVEFRRELFWRFGAAAFAGVGEVAKTFSDFSASNMVPGGGVGLRFNLAPRHHINLRVDYGLGINSHALYISVGEAF